MSHPKTKITQKQVSEAGRILSMATRQRKEEQTRHSATAHFKAAAGQPLAKEDHAHLSPAQRTASNKLRTGVAWDAMSADEQREYKLRGLGPGDVSKSPREQAAITRRVAAARGGVGTDTVEPKMVYAKNQPVPVQKTPSPASLGRSGNATTFGSTGNAQADSDRVLAEAIEERVNATLVRDPFESEREWMQHRQLAMRVRYAAAKDALKIGEMDALRQQRALSAPERLQYRELVHTQMARKKRGMPTASHTLAIYDKEIRGDVAEHMQLDAQEDAQRGHVVDPADPADQPIWSEDYKPRGVSDEEWQTTRDAVGSSPTSPAPVNGPEGRPRRMGPATRDALPPSSPHSPGILASVAGWFPHLVKAAGRAERSAVSKTAGAVASVAQLASRIGHTLAASVRHAAGTDTAAGGKQSAAWQRSKRGAEYRVGASGKKIYKSKLTQGAKKG